MTMTTDKTDEYCAMLNDAKTNMRADMFLSCFTLDRATLGYRRLRNCVILLSRGINGAGKTYKILADIEQTSAKRISADVRDMFNGLPYPPEQMFNAGYGVSRASTPTLKMSHYDKPDDIVLFLGALFLYITASDNDVKYIKR